MTFKRMLFFVVFCLIFQSIAFATDREGIQQDSEVTLHEQLIDYIEDGVVLREIQKLTPKFKTFRFTARRNTPMTAAIRSRRSDVLDLLLKTQPDLANEGYWFFDPQMPEPGGSAKKPNSYISVLDFVMMEMDLELQNDAKMHEKMKQALTAEEHVSLESEHQIIENHIYSLNLMDQLLRRKGALLGYEYSKLNRPPH